MAFSEISLCQCHIGNSKPASAPYRTAVSVHIRLLNYAQASSPFASSIMLHYCLNKTKVIGAQHSGVLPGLREPAFVGPSTPRWSDDSEACSLTRLASAIISELSLFVSC
ncbi:hypothetical protein CBL_20519 [Carabus blaptoides fortunei]